MNFKKSEILIIAIILLAFGISVYIYPQMPERIAIHWNAQGQVDGYMSKAVGLFVLPLIIFGLALVFIGIPRIMPSKVDIKKFGKHYGGFSIWFFIFMFSIHAFTILWNLGIEISLFLFLPLGMGILYIYTGFLCENAERNAFVGIRTPWTLGSGNVWDKTHKIGGKLMKVAGIVTFLGVFFQRYALSFIIVPLISVTIYTIIYSYVIYKREGAA